MLPIIPFGAPLRKIEASLRFRANNAGHLARTPAAATNRRTFTLSGWYKLGEITNTFVWGIVANNSGDNDFCAVRGNSGNVLGMQFSGRDAVICDVTTTAQLRDPTAWYHLVWAIDSTQATASDRVKMYINGVLQTSMRAAIYPALNTDFGINNNVQHYIGRFYSAANYSDCHMADIHFIDGQQLTPSAFGRSAGGVWIPSKYNGTYGTNGFHLEFSDASAATATAIGKDAATIDGTHPTANNWTPNNISVAAGPTFDQSADTPSNNLPVLLSLSPVPGVTYNGGGSFATGTSGGHGIWLPSVGMLTGKHYSEFIFTDLGSEGSFGLAQDGVALNSFVGGNTNTQSWGLRSYNGRKVYNGGETATTIASYATNVVCRAAFDADAGKLWLGTTDWVDGGDPAAGTNPTFTGLSAAHYFFALGDFTVPGQSTGGFNFGARPLTYTPPAGFKTLSALNAPQRTSGNFTGNASADGVCLILGGTPATLTCNGNAVTWGTHAIKLAAGAKLITSSGSYNASGANTFAATGIVPMQLGPRLFNNAQVN
jgi:hypothetical protein